MSFLKFMKIVGLVASVGGIVVAYVVVDDWYSKRVRLEIFATAVTVDSSLVQMSPFDLSEQEFAKACLIDIVEGDKPLEEGAATMRIPALMGGKPDLLRQFNLSTLNMVAVTLALRQVRDSVLISQEPKRFDSNQQDSVKRILSIRNSNLNDLKAMIDKYRILQKDQVRMIIRLTIANSSSAPTAVLGPLLLRLSIGELEVPLFLSGTESQMQMFGLTVGLGGPVSVIPAHSTADITLVSENAKKLGNKWSLLEKAFTSSNAQASIKFYTVDNEIHESESFPFSADFADETVKKRLKVLIAD